MDFQNGNDMNSIASVVRFLDTSGLARCLRYGVIVKAMFVNSSLLLAS